MMCDYCDCRSHGEIAELSAEHEQLLQLLAELRDASAAHDRRLAAPIISQLRAMLDPHAAREERGVFAQLLAAELDPIYVELFADDHDWLRQRCYDLDEAGWERGVDELIARLSAHIAREESDLFPTAHQLLGPQQWELMADGPQVAAVSSG
jgi:hemerythrin-like domain-containing protein